MWNMATGKEPQQYYENWDEKMDNNKRDGQHDDMNTNDDVDNWLRGASHHAPLHKQFHWMYVVSHLSRTLCPHSH